MPACCGPRLADQSARRENQIGRLLAVLRDLMRLDLLQRLEPVPPFGGQVRLGRTIEKSTLTELGSGRGLLPVQELSTRVHEIGHALPPLGGAPYVRGEYGEAALDLQV